MDQAEQLETKYERQRRNLMLISAIVLFLFVGRYSLTQINILGNIFSVNDPSNLLLVVAIIFIYFLLRCFQFYNQLNICRPTLEYRNQFIELSDLIHRLTKRKEIKEFVKEHFDLDKIIWLTIRKDMRSMLEREDGTTPGGLDDMLPLHMWKINYSFYVQGLRNGKEVTSGGGQQLSVKVHGGLVGWVLYKYSVLLVGIRKHYFSQYQLPFILAMSVSLASLYSVVAAN